VSAGQVAGTQQNQRVLLVRFTSVVTTTERVFVTRVKDGTAEWVDVKRGPAQNDLAEVLGPPSRTGPGFADGYR
jgi:hypothetical protein